MLIDCATFSYVHSPVYFLMFIVRYDGLLEMSDRLWFHGNEGWQMAGPCSVSELE